MNRTARLALISVLTMLLSGIATIVAHADTEPDPKVGTPLTLYANNTSVEITPLEIVDPAQAVPGQPAPVTGVAPPAYGPDGSRLVAVKLKLTNTGYGDYTDVPTESAALLDADENGYPADARAITVGSTLNGTVTVGPGKSLTGYIVFEIPKDAKPAHLQYALDRGLALQSARWSIG